MCDDTLCAYTKHTVGHLFVRRDPTASVLLPAKLWECAVQTTGERGQHYLDVEVSDSLLRRLRSATSAPLVHQNSLYQIWVVDRKWVSLGRNGARRGSQRHLSALRTLLDTCYVA